MVYLYTSFISTAHPSHRSHFEFLTKISTSVLAQVSYNVCQTVKATKGLTITGNVENALALPQLDTADHQDNVLRIAKVLVKSMPEVIPLIDDR